MPTKMYHFVYKTSDPITGKFYIGKHSTTDLSDGYQGSGLWVKRALKKGKVLTTEVISYHETSEEAFAAELELVASFRGKDTLCMNFKRGGLGGFVSTVWSGESNQKRIETCKTFSHIHAAQKMAIEVRRGSKASEWTKHLLSQANLGKTLDKETKSKIASALKGKSKTEAHNRAVSEAKKGKPLPTGCCPHCGKETTIPLLDRWHNENCKERHKS